MGIKIVKGMLFIIPTIFMALILMFMPEVADSSSVAYVTLIGVFLGFDLWSMIQKTKAMPSGMYDKLKLWRYIIVALSLVSLLALAFLRRKDGTELGVTLSSFSAAVFVVFGLVIAGLDGNRIATDNPNVVTTAEEIKR